MVAAVVLPFVVTSEVVSEDPDTMVAAVCGGVISPSVTGSAVA